MAYRPSLSGAYKPSLSGAQVAAREAGSAALAGGPLSAGSVAGATVPPQDQSLLMQCPCVKRLTRGSAGKLPKHSLAAQAAANLERFKGPPSAQPEVPTLLHPS